ncbi:oligosaccharide flippase family protein [Mesobacillus sp. AQ2]|uniref:oligosaccharide flippase family protein n=1 Tax=Mesobacillus sp. AQ2 TaxID=3043332 RepID=UPI0024C0E916|nr:oligosaccharide flippase family protein [Mesobacillus sp. AQ2]WHX41431.1 oligosaccharide flippase family protein [Mesobacillus sp. AQ2]
MKNQLKAGAILSYTALIINSLISILYTPIMLNLLGQSEYGLYSLANSATGYIGVLNFGLGNAVIRYTAKYKALNDEESCSRIYGMFFRMYFVLGLIALLAGSFLTWNSGTIFGSSLTVHEQKTLEVLMAIVTLNLSLGIGLGLFSVIVLAHEKFIFQKLVVIAGSIISPLVMLPLLIMGYGTVAMVTITAIINIVTIFLNAFYCFRFLRIKISFKKVENSLFKEVMFFSSYIFLNLIISKLYDTTDQVLLGIYSGTAAISIYAIGTMFTGYFSGFSSAISNVFLSKVTRMTTKETSDEELSNLFIRIGRLQYIVVSFALSGFIVFGKEFIILWVGKDYELSYTIAIIILIPMIVSLLQSMGGVILQAKNMQKFKTIINAAVAVGNVFLSILFVQWWGPVGAAIGTAIAFFIGNVLIINIYYWKKIQINIPDFWKNIILMSVPLIISLLFGFTINGKFPVDSWLLFAIKISIFTLVFLILMWITAMNRYEKELITFPLHYYFKKRLQGKGI